MGNPSAGRSEIRILYALDDRRHGILLLGGDKAGAWDAWYEHNVPVADTRFKAHMAETHSANAGAAAEKTSTSSKKHRGRKGR